MASGLAFPGALHRYRRAQSRPPYPRSCARPRAARDSGLRSCTVACSLRHLTLTGLSILGAIGLQAGALTAQADSSARPIAITHVTVIDVTGGRRLTDQTVVVAGNRIIAVGPGRDVRVPAGARIVPGAGRFLIPGLWDMHTHLALYG